MADSSTALRQADTAVQALGRLAGTWRISGDATGTVRYRWLPGGFFLAQEGELELFGHKNAFTEIIGRHRPFGRVSSVEIHSRVYTSEGDTLDYVYELDGDTLTIWGGHRGSEAHYTGTFSADGDTLTPRFRHRHSCEPTPAGPGPGSWRPTPKSRAGTAERPAGAA